jgi:hypothetical protein
MRPKASVIPIPAEIGGGTIFEGRSFKIDQNALGAYYESTKGSLYKLLAQMQQAELAARPLVAKYRAIMDRVGKEPLTPKDESEIAGINQQVSEATRFVNPKHQLVAIWAGLQHQWIGKKASHEEIDVEEIGESLDSETTGAMMILLQAAFLPPSDLPKEILEGAKKNGDGEVPLTQMVASGGVGPSPVPVSTLQMKNTEN